MRIETGIDAVIAGKRGMVRDGDVAMVKRAKEPRCPKRVAAGG